MRLSARVGRDIALKPEVARVFAESFAVYRFRKVWRQRVREGFGVARCTVERLMRDMDLAGVNCGKPVRRPSVTRQPRARWITSSPSSMRLRRTGCGCRTLPMSRLGAGLSMSYSSSMFMRAMSLVGGSAGRPMPASCSMPWSRHCMIDGQFIVAA